MDKPYSDKQMIRFRTPDELKDYLEDAGAVAELVFRAHPIAGSPETFYYHGRDKVVVRKKDGQAFDSLEDFTCYAFQCDVEGYTHTEHVDVEMIN